MTLGALANSLTVFWKFSREVFPVHTLILLVLMLIQIFISGVLPVWKSYEAIDIGEVKRRASKLSNGR